MEGKELRRLADEFHKERIILEDMRRREAMISADINQKQLANNEVARMANAQQEEVRIEAECVCMHKLYLMMVKICFQSNLPQDRLDRKVIE